MSAGLDESGLAILRDWVTDKIGKKRSILKLLWTNPSPASNFAAQTITVPDMGDYDFIAIQCSYDTSETYRGYAFIPANDWVGKSVDVFAHIDHIEANRTGGRRVSSPLPTLITFGTGYYNGSSGASYAIPRLIYGINLNSDVKDGKALQLLWENADLTTAFAAQTVLVDVRPYDFYFIESRYTTDQTQEITAMQIVGQPMLLLSSTMGNNYNQSRRVTCNVDGSLTFDNTNYNGETSSGNNSRIIPYRIYGVSMNRYIVEGDSGSVPTKSIRLLWENASPSSSFGAQTVTLSEPVENFEFILMDYTSTVVRPRSTGLVRVTPDLGTTGRRDIFFGATSNNRIGARDWYVSGTSAQFSACAYNNSTNNDYGKPLRIYGVNL